MIDKVINVDLLKHPMNWIIVVLMVIIAGAAAHFIVAGFNQNSNATVA